MTTTVQAQVAAAPVGSTFASTDGASVGAWRWERLASSWRISMGFTGYLDVTYIDSNATSGKIYISRTDYTVRFKTDSLITTSNTFDLPDGFRVDFIQERCSVSDGSGKSGLVKIGWAVEVYSLTNVSLSDIEVSFHTDNPRPTTLPGTAA